MSTPLPASNGALAEISLWDVTAFALADLGDLAALLGTASPTAPNPLAVNSDTGEAWEGAIESYWRMMSPSDINDRTGIGHHMTVVGSLSTFGTHPPVAPVPAAAAALLLQYYA